MLILIKGANMSGGTTVGLAIQKDTDLRERVNRLIRGAEEIKTEWLEDDGCVVTIEIKRKKLKKILKEDRKWEELQYRRALRDRKMTGYSRRVREVQLTPKLKSPTKAAVMGLMFPGMGLVYAGDKKLGGIAGTLILALGVKGVEEPGFLYGAGALHLLQAYWGVKSVNETNARFTFVPNRYGGHFVYSKRF
jgi:hypothetical protein